ncbi:outer membrane beta-barrel protein, partial [Acinetobacter baumannii]
KKEKQELDILATSSLGQNNSDYAQQQYYQAQSNPFAGSASHNPGTDHEYNFSIDYTHPIAKDMVVETGAKYIIQNI